MNKPPIDNLDKFFRVWHSEYCDLSNEDLEKLRHDSPQCQRAGICRAILAVRRIRTQLRKKP